MFRPILLGATPRDRILACLAAIAGIALTGAVTHFVLGPDAQLLLVAPLGASAVLVFAVPASPLAQPWPLIGGNTISALVGVAVAQIVPDPMLAAGCAVGLAIAAMSLTRTLHPPGGAMALTAVIGGAAVHDAGFIFALAPACLNSVLLGAAAWTFHRFSGHTYPHVAKPMTRIDVPTAAPLIHEIDIDAAIAEMGDAFDINRADLHRLLQLAERNAQARMSERAVSGGSDI